jgi:hypothetical protein
VSPKGEFWQQSVVVLQALPAGWHVAHADAAAQTPSDWPSTAAQHPLWHSALLLHAACQRLSLLRQIAPDGPMPDPD